MTVACVCVVRITSAPLGNLLWVESGMLGCVMVYKVSDPETWLATGIVGGALKKQQDSGLHFSPDESSISGRHIF